jgi:hypothetical protein
MRRTPTWILSILIVVSAAACESAAPPPKVADDSADLAFIRLDPTLVKGFSAPDTVVHLAGEDVYLVSNINGDPFDGKKDNGFISKVSPEGKVLDLKWIDGATEEHILNAPKGMVLTEGRLYVADIDTVRVFDLKDRRSIGRFKIPNATDLNAMTADADGSVYVSNSGMKKGENGLEPTGKDSVYSLSRFGSIRKIASGEDLNHPSGLAADAKGVWVVTQNAKQVFHISKWGKREKPNEMPEDGLEAAVRLRDGRLLVSVPDKGLILSGWPASGFRVALDKIDGPSGIGYDFARESLLVPLAASNQLLIQPLGEL